MRINGFGGSGLINLKNMNLPTANRSVQAQAQEAPQDQRQQIQFAKEQVANLRRSLEDISKIWRRDFNQNMRTITTTSYKPASASSGLDLGLGGATASYLNSKEEINDYEHSISTYSPDFSGTSTAQATLSGKYNGSDGTDTLTFKVTEAGAVGENDFIIQMFDSAGNELDEAKFKKSHDAGHTVKLNNGLELSFSEGDLVLDDSFTVGVYEDVGAVANPDNPFNGVGDAGANLESEVQNGTFDVNGYQIEVLETDSINSVLAKINDSAAGVTATYSSETETINIVQNTPGPDGEIKLEHDTSGFLKATKLNGAQVVEGSEPGADIKMKDLERFDDVVKGDFLINGTSIYMDPKKDTLQDVLDRINASDAGVTASVNAEGNMVTITSNDPKQNMTFDSNGTNFFAALELPEGVNEPTVTVTQTEVPGSDGKDISKHRATSIAQHMKDAIKALNNLYGMAIPGQDPGLWLDRTREDLKGTIEEVIDRVGTSKLGKIGLDFEFQSQPGTIMDFNGQDRTDMIGSILSRTASVEKMLFQTKTSKHMGLVDGLLDRISTVESYLDGALGPTGNTVDTYA